MACYRPGDRASREPTCTPTRPDGRWRAYDDDEIVQRDKCSLDVFWLKDESLEASENLPDQDVIAGEIADDLRAALEPFDPVALDLATRERPGAL